MNLKIYLKVLEVKIKHSRIPENHRHTLKEIFESIGQNKEWYEEYTELRLPNEESISIITRALSKSNVDIYRVEVNEPSLKEIFLNLGNERIPL